MSFFDNLFDEKGIIGLVLQGSFVSHLVLLVLLFMSSLTWAVIFLKWTQFRRLGAENYEFLQIFYKEHKFEQIYNMAVEFENSPLARVFEASYREIVQFRQKIQQQNPGISTSESLQRLNTRLLRIYDRTVAQQHQQLEHRLNALATVSSSGPFIGLFGTVLGIIDSFQNIGTKGATSLAVVAPGISEALVATAAGLLAAIPALMAYNYYRNYTRQMVQVMRNFALELSNRVEWII